MRRKQRVAVLVLSLCLGCVGWAKQVAGKACYANEASRTKVATEAFKRQCESRIDPRWVLYCDTLANSVCNPDTNLKSLPLPQPDEFAGAIAPRLQVDGLVDQLIQYQSQRLDKQTGNDTAKSGSTSLVSRPGIPTLLAVAVESGALAQSSNGTSTTVQGNAAGLYNLLTGKPTVCPNLVSCGSIPFLTQVAVTSTLSIAQSGASSSPISGPGNTGLPTNSLVSVPSGHTKLQTLSIRYEISNNYDPHSDAFKRAFFEFVKKAPEFRELSKQAQIEFSNVLSAAGEIDVSPLLNNEVLAKCRVKDAKGNDRTDEQVLDCAISRAAEIGDKYVDLLRSQKPDEFDAAVTKLYTGFQTRTCEARLRMARPAKVCPKQEMSCGATQ